MELIAVFDIFSGFNITNDINIGDGIELGNINIAGADSSIIGALPFRKSFIMLIGVNALEAAAPTYHAGLHAFFF